MRTQELRFFVFFSRKYARAGVSWEAAVVIKNKITTGESPLVLILICLLSS